MGRSLCGHPIETPGRPPLVPLAVRAAVGGALMGLANLVPGISGGTMLVASGVYDRFITAISELTRGRFGPASMVTLGVVVGAAVLAIALLAGTMARLVTGEPMVMFSLFIGLTLGGVPVLRRMLGKATPGAWVAGLVMFLAMGALAYVQSFGPASDGTNQGFAFMFLAGVVAAGAMILPGVSGGYLFLVLGVYVPVLQGIDALKTTLRAGDWAAAAEPAVQVVLPILLGVVVGIAGVSNALRWLLKRYETATLGALVGLLIGAVVGLWPFQEPPPAGEIQTIKGRPVAVAADGALVYAGDGEAVEPEDVPMRPRRPAGVGEIAGSLGLIVVGFGATALLARLGRERVEAGGRAGASDGGS